MKKQKGVVQSAGEEESEIDDEQEEEARPISDKNEQIFFDFFSKLAGRDRAVSGKFKGWSTRRRRFINAVYKDHLL